MTKPSIAELLIASGHTDFQLSLVLQASQTFYGDVGANLDERDWGGDYGCEQPIGVGATGAE